MEDSDEFKWAVKVVIKRQMRDLMDQLRERGEEIAILTVNLDDNSCSHFGSPNGEWFVSEQKNLTNNFLNFCRFKDKRGGGRSACSTPQKGAYSSPKAAKSSALNQKSTSDIASLRVTVPRQLAGDVSEEDLAGLVGRIVASQLAVQEKGDGSSGGTKFDLLVAAANRSRKKGDTGSNMSTPSTTRSTRKRKVSAKYREGMTSLKRGWKSEEDDTGSDQETGTEENVVISMLAELSTSVLRRVKVKTSDGIPVSLERSMLMSSVVLESLALLVVQELNDIAGGLLTKEKTIKMHVSIDENNNNKNIGVQYSMENGDLINAVEMDDSDMEYLDQQVDEAEVCWKSEFDNAVGGGESLSEDSVYDPNEDFDDSFNLKHLQSETVMGTMSNTDLIPSKKGRGRPRSLKPRRKMRSSSETTPINCDQCDAVLTGISNLNSHVRRIHLKLKKYQCKICLKAFFTQSRRDEHISVIHTKKCEACNEIVQETVLWGKGTQNTTLREVICSCGETIRFFSKLGRAKGVRLQGTLPKRKRPESEMTPLTCEHCFTTLTGRSSLLSHIKRMHMKVRNHKCKICMKEFYSYAHLENHMLSLHMLKCQTCQDLVMETEPWPKGTERWMERIVKCKCGCAVSMVTALGRKLKDDDESNGPPKKRRKSRAKYAPGTRFVCGTCGKIFPRKSEAMSHTCSNKHTSTSVVKCEICEECFSNENDKTVHYKEVHNVEPAEEKLNVEEATDGLLIEKGSQVVVYQTDGQSATDAPVPSIQIMHDGELLATEQVLDRQGNMSLIIKHIE